MISTPSPWIVLKFGGTSVSSRANWNNIAQVASARRASGARVLIVHSALSGVTDHLERLLESAVRQAAEPELRAIEERHRQLAAELAVDLVRRASGSSPSCVSSPPASRGWVR